MALVNQEQAAEHYAAAETHMAGLKKIADLHGGLDNIGDAVAAVKICRTDILFAMQQGGRPLFHRDHICHTKRNLAYKGSLYSKTRLPALVDLTQLSKKHSLTPWDCADCSTNTMMRSLSISLNFKKSWYLSAIDCCNFDRIARRGLINALVKEAIESKLNEDEDEFRFWLLILGGISVPARDGREWLVEALREQASLLGIMTWEQVKECLVRVPWMDAIHDQPGRKLWDQVRLMDRGWSHKAKESIDELKAEFPDVDYRFLEVDLSSQESVRKTAKEVLSWSDIPCINFIINSAGVVAVQEHTLTKDGIEMHLATNHIGHWLLSCLLMPKLIKASEGKPKGSVCIVNVTSASPMGSNMRWSDMNFDRKNKDLPQEEQPNYELLKLWGYENSEEAAYVPLDGYNRSKVANVLFGIEANRRLFENHGILTLSAHPGVIMTTELGRNFPKETVEAVEKLGAMGVYTHKSVEAGASTSLVAALDPKLANGVGETHEGSENYGSYLADCQISTGAKPLAVSSSEAKKLWNFSEEATGQKFPW
ncbi:double substrate-specificity short chain dehydrogenase reductase 2 [Fusarium agapanthi]|uniref:Double substrate-specificity short chain dehydrogenase reductase 2 n=1 Tax=Fusarium agapanthi TaxID=1803897 RepID=A0A9P5EA62_9HYPO|nr:double substrate-specificity short chain dehydrogenase reductase 2 [Fusarium agapanthi]